jgi:hypothetical protein
MLPNDTHYEILNYLDDYSLVEICQTNKDYYDRCKNNKFITNRIGQYLEKRKELQALAIYWNKNNTSPIDLKNIKK